MKCPKCNYITFDYLDTCPKCGKDMSEEKESYNIFGIKPDPPFLLKSLIGDIKSDGYQRGPALERSAADNRRLEDESVFDDGSELDIDFDDIELQLDLDEEDMLEK